MMMKKVIIVLMITTLSSPASSQDDSARQLETLCKVWGSCYMLHPSVVREDNNLNWEHSLVRFVQNHPANLSFDDYINRLNQYLLAELDDPLTVLQTPEMHSADDTTGFVFRNLDRYDYMRLPASFLSQPGNWRRFDSTLSEKTGEKPLVLDLRLYSKLEPHEAGLDCFDYISGFLTPENLPTGSSVSRYHLGWDEMNHQAFYKQEWKVTNQPLLLTLAALPEKETRKYPSFDFSRPITIGRPVFLLFNNTTLSYYLPELNALRKYRTNINLLWEKRGMIPDNGLVLSLPINEATLFLNPYVFLNKTSGFQADYESANPINQTELGEIIQTRVYHTQPASFSFNLTPRIYPSSVKPLTPAYKLLGLSKLWAVLRYLYPWPVEVPDKFETSPARYVKPVMATSNDRQYYKVLGKMIGVPGMNIAIWDYSELYNFSESFVVPLQFRMLDKRVYVTASGKTTRAMGIDPGDEILGIEGRTMDQIVSEAVHTFIGYTGDALMAQAFNRDHFKGRAGTSLKITILDEQGFKTIEVPRTVNVSSGVTGPKQACQEVIPDDIEYLVPTGEAWLGESSGQGRVSGFIVDLRNRCQPIIDPAELRTADKLDDAGLITRTPVLSASEPQSKIIHADNWQGGVDQLFQSDKPVAVLIGGASTASNERLAYLLSRRKNVLLLGEPTPGRWAKITGIHLPGGAEFFFPGQQVRAPEGQMMRGGLQPDITVKPTLESLRSGKDPVIEEALHQIMKGNVVKK